MEKIFGKRPWKSRSEEIIEANEKMAPALEDMPEAVKQAEAEHQRRVAEQQKNSKDARQEAPADEAQGDTGDKEEKA